MTWDWSYARAIFGPILSAFLRYTLTITVAAFILAVVLGLVIALIRRATMPVLPRTVGAVAHGIRVTPIPVQLFFVYYVLPNFGVTLSAVVTGVLVLGIHYATYCSEVYRAGIQDIPIGQWEACSALSLPPRAVWAHVVLPQVVRRILPPLGNYALSMFKEIPFLLFISVPEMVSVAKNLGGDSYRYVEPFTICGLIYLAVSYPLSQALRTLEARLGR